MHLSETLHLPLGVADVASMYADPAYADVRARVLHAHEATATVQGYPADAFTVTTSIEMPTDGIPDLMRRFVGTTVTIRETQTWQAPAADGSRRGSIAFEVAGAPASMTGDVALTPEGEAGAEMRIDGELVAKVPLLGRKIEQAALPYVSRVLALEERSAADYAAGSAR